VTRRELNEFAQHLQSYRKLSLLSPNYIYSSKCHRKRRLHDAGTNSQLLNPTSTIVYNQQYFSLVNHHSHDIRATLKIKVQFQQHLHHEYHLKLFDFFVNLLTENKHTVIASNNVSMKYWFSV